MNTRFLLLAAIGLTLAGCATSGAAYDEAQPTGALAKNSVTLANQAMNLEFQNRVLAAYAEEAHRRALSTYGQQSRDQVAGNASEAAIRGYQGELNALQAGSDIRTGSRTVTEALEQQTQALSRLAGNLEDLRKEVDSLKAASGGQ